MDIVIISATALIASTLTLFSGFGLGTLLMPVVAIFFPIEIAIAITALVHFANNIFKILLLGKNANLSVLAKFGLPAILFAIIGAWTLHSLSSLQPLYQYSINSHHFVVEPIKMVVGIIILVFVGLELSPRFSTIKLDRKYLPFGGMISGFFGGLSGHQGAFRSMFLIKAGLDKHQFIATGVAIAVMVDFARMSIYGWDIANQSTQVDWYLVISAALSAFLGAYVGAKLVKKITIVTIQLAVSALLAVISLGLIFGLL